MNLIKNDFDASSKRERERERERERMNLIQHDERIKHDNRGKSIYLHCSNHN